MSQLKTHHPTGIALGLIGGLVISFDVPIIRLAGSDPWLIMALRGGVLALVFFVVWRLAPRATQTPRRPLESPYWLWVGIIYGINNILFTLGVFHTSTANLVFILAFNPMLAALFSWWLIGEKPRTETIVAIGMTVLGVGLIVREGLALGTGLGDLFALGCAGSLALAITLTRKSGEDLSLAPGFGGLVSLAFSLPLVIAWSSMPQSLPWAIGNAAILVPVAAFCLALAPRFIPAPQAAMFYLLETVLAPIWVWMVFDEKVETMTLIGGAIILAALTGHSLIKLRQRKNQRRVQTVNV
jgi:drug/metabolite transporter (DMT)-like permease